MERKNANDLQKCLHILRCSTTEKCHWLSSLCSFFFFLRNFSVPTILCNVFLFLIYRYLWVRCCWRWIIAIWKYLAHIFIIETLLSRIRIVLTLFFFYEKRNICSQVLFWEFFQRFKIFRKNTDRVENENFARDDNLLSFI